MKKARVLFYDIENTPNLAYVWDKYEQNVIAYKKEWEILSVAYKFQGDKEVTFVSREGRKTDLNVVKALHKIFSEADLLIAHNGDSFDQRKAKARMAFHGLTPPKILNSLDTKKIAKNYFRFNSNSLNDLGEHFGLGKKVKHQGFELWEGCMADKRSAWKVMEKYNKQDVVLLEKLYNKFLPWIQNHPSIAKMQNPAEAGGGCPNCGGTSIRKEGFRATHAQVKRQWSCNTCGGWFLTAVRKGDR